MGQGFRKYSEFRESHKSPKHELESIQSFVFYMCLTGTVVDPWSIAQEEAGLSTFTVVTNISSMNSAQTLSYKWVSHQSQLNW